MESKSTSQHILISIITLTFIFSYSCHTAQTSTVAEIGDYRKLVEEKLGDDAQTVHSPDDTFVLCFKDDQGTPKQPQNLITYFVYDLKKKEIIHEDVFGPGTIKWFDGNKLEIFVQPGLMPDNKSRIDFTYIYNVETKKRSPKANFDELK